MILSTFFIEAVCGTYQRMSGEIRKGKGKKEEKGGRRRDGESSGQRSCQCDDEG